MIKSIRTFLVLAALALTATGCNSGKSYAELLNDETHAVNYFLADQRVINRIPEDNKFISALDEENPPFYRIDADGNLYMQVINPGDPNDMAEYDELIYFRFTRYNLKTYQLTGELIGDGNSDNLSFGSTSFRYQNTQLTSTSSFGMGIQEPLKFLGIGCEVNLVIKSQLGPSSEIASVIPFLYNIRYFRSPL